MILLKQNQLDEAVEFLKQGKTLVFPTETAYGLGCDATNQEAVDKIFKIKERKSDKPLLVVVPDVGMAKKYLVWNDLLEDLSKKYWPGPLTVVGECNKNENLATGVLAADSTIAVRVTNFPLTKFLSEQLGRPLVATSANLADAGNIYTVKELEEVFSANEAKPDILVDGGELLRNPPTTIVKIIDNPDFASSKIEDARFRSNRNRHNLQILRQGQLKIN